MPAGRPTAYKPEYCEQLLEHMAEGLSFESFAGVIGTCRRTLYYWTEQHEEFLHAKNAGQEKSQLFWEKGMRALAFGKLAGGNAATMLFTMKCRFGWREADEEKGDITVKLAYNLDEDSDDE